MRLQLSPDSGYRYRAALLQLPQLAGIPGILARYLGQCMYLVFVPIGHSRKSLGDK